MTTRRYPKKAMTTGEYLLRPRVTWGMLALSIVAAFLCVEAFGYHSGPGYPLVAVGIGFAILSVILAGCAATLALVLTSRWFSKSAFLTLRRARSRNVQNRRVENRRTRRR